MYTGMLRPGLLELLAHLRAVGATIVVYTHSEEKWAIKVCEAMERMAGWPFIKRVFSRLDCKDGHPNFTARKSLEFVCEQLKSQDGLGWVDVEQTIMFDDDGNALGKNESDRLVKVSPLSLSFVSVLFPVAVSVFVCLCLTSVVVSVSVPISVCVSIFVCAIVFSWSWSMSWSMSSPLSLYVCLIVFLFV